MSLIGVNTISRVALYIRVSTEEQAQEGWSVDAQERALRSFCQAKDWHIVEVYKDEGRTGTNTDRPGFQAMLRDAHERRFDAVVVHKLDRFSRNLVDVLMTLDDLQKKGVSFVSTTEANLDFTTPLGRMMLGVMGTISQWYVDNLRSETTKGKKERFEQGLFNGDLRFGYSKGEDGRPMPNSDAEGVRLAYQWCVEGKTDIEIAALLNAAGYRTYRLIENNVKKATPDIDPKLRRPWTKDSVASLLRAGQFYLGNTEYVGEGERKLHTRANQRGENYTLQKQLKTGTHPAVITQELHEQAMAARAKRVNPGRATAKQNPKIYLLGGGLACCSACGRPLRSSHSMCGKLYQYYQCTAVVRGYECSASQKYVREGCLIPQIESMIDRLSLPDDWRQRAIELASVGSRDSDDRINRRKALEVKLQRLSLEHREGFVEDEEYVKAAREIKSELARIPVATTYLTVVESGEVLITIRSSWKKATKEQQREMLRIMLDAVYIDTDEWKVVSVQPQPDFLPVFREAGLVENAGRFSLK